MKKLFFVFAFIIVNIAVSAQNPANDRIRQINRSLEQKRVEDNMQKKKIQELIEDSKRTLFSAQKKLDANAASPAVPMSAHQSAIPKTIEMIKTDAAHSGIRKMMSQDIDSEQIQLQERFRIESERIRLNLNGQKQYFSKEYGISAFPDSLGTLSEP